MKRYYSNGKLLIAGEYVVLDGALSLAVPTKYGQSLIVESLNKPKLIWESLDESGTVWFNDSFLIKEVTSGVSKPSNEVSKKLIEILKTATNLNSNFLNSAQGYKVTAKLDFPKNWGLGSSSTLLYNIASWAKVDAYQLLEKTFGGSGYDIACAQHDNAITYQLLKEGRRINQVQFNPSFKDNLYFVYLNKKQNSREGIKQYRNNNSDLSKVISEIKDIIVQMIDCTNLDEFENLMNTHEHIISCILKQDPIKKLLFNDFKGSIKSLGAWGGDFILVASKENPEAYFNNKGFTTVIKYSEMIL